MQFRKTSPLKSGESSENPVEKIASNPVTSVAVMVFSALNQVLHIRCVCFFGVGVGLGGGEVLNIFLLAPSTG